MQVLLSSLFVYLFAGRECNASGKLPSELSGWIESGVVVVRLVLMWGSFTSFMGPVVFVVARFLGHVGPSTLVTGATFDIRSGGCASRTTYYSGSAPNSCR